MFFFKQKTAYEMRISDWSSDVCSSDLACRLDRAVLRPAARGRRRGAAADRRQGGAARQVREAVGRRAAGGDLGDRRCRDEIGRASCRERGCQYVWISVVDVSVKKKQRSHNNK